MNLNEVTASPRLDALFARTRYDTDKQTAHSYGPVYECLLAPFLNRPCTLLEVGVNSGGSLRLWHDLLPHATIIGLDDRKCCAIEIERLARCKIMTVDAYTRHAVQEVRLLAPNGIDVLLDDGPHTPASQQLFLRLYLPLLNPQGFALIEDIQDEDTIPWLVGTLDPAFEATVIDRRHQKDRYDDLMLLVRRVTDAAGLS